jgi:hypothetical protein
MTNRTDFEDVAKEFIDHEVAGYDISSPAERAALAARLATELHNAFVAGQESASAFVRTKGVRPALHYACVNCTKLIAETGMCDPCSHAWGMGRADHDELEKLHVEVMAATLAFREALEEIAKNAETMLAGGLPHFSRRDFAETVAHCARHALGQEVSFDSVQIRCKLRYHDGRVEFIELPGVKLTTEGAPPLFIRHGAAFFAHGHGRRTIDGRFIYDEAPVTGVTT